LANTKQAKKRARKSEELRQHNVTVRSAMRTAIKRIRAAIASKDKSKAQEAYTAAVPLVDRMANKGFIHKNTAARYKSRINARIRAI
jgi:small subunit ribosomal protein S20